MPRLLVRRSLTAVGIYSSVVLGFVATVVAARELHPHKFGDYATVIFATSFFQSLFDLTVEEALVKYGFRYVTREDWGRLRRLFASAWWFKVAGSVLGGLGLLAFAELGPARLTVPLLIAAAIPLGQSLEGLAGTPLYLHGRYDTRAAFQALSMGLRLAGVVVGARYGLVQAIAGVLAAQVVATAAIGLVGWIAFHRFPRARATPLGEDRRPIASFVLQSSAATGVLSVRSGLAPLLLGAVTSTTQVGYFRVAQAPQSGFAALSAPARMVLLTEQTRDWERGRQSAVLRGVRRFSLAALGLCVVAVPLLLVYLPDLIRWIYKPQFSPAVGAARVFVLVAAVQLVLGWTKSFPVSIGRPGLRIWTHGIETLVMLPLVVVLGAHWGATGAAVAVLAGTVVFAAVWVAVLVRIHPEDVEPPAALDETLAETQAETAALIR